MTVFSCFDYWIYFSFVQASAERSATAIKVAKEWPAPYVAAPQPCQLNDSPQFAEAQPPRRSMACPSTALATIAHHAGMICHSHEPELAIPHLWAAAPAASALLLHHHVALMYRLMV
jgi:hypothetical protein